MAKRSIQHSLASKVWVCAVPGLDSGLTVPFSCNWTWFISSFLLWFTIHQEYLCRLMKSLCLADNYEVWNQKPRNSKRMWKPSKTTWIAHNFLGTWSSAEWELFLYEELSLPKTCSHANKNIRLVLTLNSVNRLYFLPEVFLKKKKKKSCTAYLPSLLYLCMGIHAVFKIGL